MTKLTVVSPVGKLNLGDKRLGLSHVTPRAWPVVPERFLNGDCFWTSFKNFACSDVRLRTSNPVPTRPAYTSLWSLS